MIDSWKPRIRRDYDYRLLDLNREEGYICSRIDGETSVWELMQVTGLAQERLCEILAALYQQGVIERQGAPAEIAGKRKPAGPTPRPAPSKSEALPDWLIVEERDVRRADDHGFTAASPPILTPVAASPPLAAEDPLMFITAGKEQPPREAAAAPAEADIQDAGPASPAAQRSFFLEELSKLPRERRVKMASQASGRTLSALCFDPDPEVIRALLGNLRAGVEHARTIASHHQSPEGLQAVCAWPRFMSDEEVRRRLLRNAKIPDATHRRLLDTLPMPEIYRQIVDRHSGERIRRNARQALRRRFQRASSGERLDLILRTEGQCLAELPGLHLDQETAELLRGFTYDSLLLIRNLAGFPSTPPRLIRHLLSQKPVRESPDLLRLLQNHPQCPRELRPRSY